MPLLITGASPTGAIEAKIAAEELQNFFNVPTKWIEPKALTTKENALFTKQILEKESIHKIILVTNEWHMQRAKLLFQQQGFDVLPASVGEGITPDSYGLQYDAFYSRKVVQLRKICNYSKSGLDIGKSAKVRSKDHEIR